MSSGKRVTKAELFQSMGTLDTFIPVGHIVLAFADDATTRQAARALADAGFDAADVLVCTSAELEPPLNALLRAASGAAGFGYEVTLLRRYLDLASQGAGWLVVHAPQDDAAEKVGEVARRFDTRAGVRYHRLASEELIEPDSKRGQL
jgi:hypothetical protein